MKKAKYFLSGIIAIMLLLTTAATGLTISNASRGPTLEVTTDKYVYLVGELVTIFLTNVGDETLCGGGPIITIYDEKYNIVYQEATYCWHELEPGEYIEWPPWDQTDQQGEQVPDGEYTAEGYLSNGNGGGWVDEAVFYIGDRNDELDQSQPDYTESAVIPVGAIDLPNLSLYIQAAQSFIPSKELLTRVEIYIGKNSTATYPYIVGIRDDLTEEDLTLASVDPEDIVTGEFGWVEFDFDDVLVTTGETYYLVSYTENVTNNWYAWAANNDSESYPYGCAWMSLDGGETWSNESAPAPQHSNVEKSVKTAGRETLNGNETWDMCFKTYGRDNSAPEAPIITGKTNGKTGETYTYCIDTVVDPDGDIIYVYWDWGDGTNSGWLGPYASGEQVCADHSWSKDGTYTIKAKLRDEYGAESDWGYLEVTMPVNYPSSQNGFNILLSKFLQRFSQFFPLVKTLLGL